MKHYRIALVDGLDKIITEFITLILNVEQFGVSIPIWECTASVDCILL